MAVKWAAPSHSVFVPWLGIISCSSSNMPLPRGVRRLAEASNEQSGRVRSLCLANNLASSIQDSKLGSSNTRGVGDEYMYRCALLPLLLKLTAPAPWLSRIVVMTVSSDVEDS